jgi:hypothetical protein
MGKDFKLLTFAVRVLEVDSEKATCALKIVDGKHPVPRPEKSPEAEAADLVFVDAKAGKVFHWSPPSQYMSEAMETDETADDVRMINRQWFSTAPAICATITVEQGEEAGLRAFRVFQSIEMCVAQAIKKVVQQVALNGDCQCDTCNRARAEANKG